MKTEYSRPWLLRVFRPLVYMCAFTSSWSGLRVSGVTLSDILLVLAVVLGVAVGPGPNRLVAVRYSVVAWIPAIVAVSIAAIDVVYSRSALTSTTETSSFLVGQSAFSDQGGSLLYVLRLALSTGVVAFLCLRLAQHEPISSSRNVLRAWSYGIAVSALLAVTDSTGVTSIKNAIYHIETIRSVGLSWHPNSLAQAIVVSIPILFWCISQARQLSAKVALAAVVTLDVYAILLADSRGGILVGSLVLAACIGVLVWKRAGVEFAAPALGALLLAAYLLVPVVVAGSRFSAISAEQSTSGRADDLVQAWNLFLDSPVIGVGLDSGEGVMVVLTLLSAGGIVLASAYFLFVGTGIAAAARVDVYMTISTLSCVAFGVFNNNISERYTFWVAGLALVLGAAGRTSEFAGAVARARGDGDVGRLMEDPALGRTSAGARGNNLQSASTPWRR